MRAGRDWPVKPTILGLALAVLDAGFAGAESDYTNR